MCPVSGWVIHTQFCCAGKGASRGPGVAQPARPLELGQEEHQPREAPAKLQLPNRQPRLIPRAGAGPDLSVSPLAAAGPFFSTRNSLEV